MFLVGDNESRDDPITYEEEILDINSRSLKEAMKSEWT